MELKDCIKFANETPVCYLATAEGDQPSVRALGSDLLMKLDFNFKSVL
jgi:uncharacterized pyridoxamine 5'-phosphate oxidase family protein